VVFLFSLFISKTNILEWAIKVQVRSSCKALGLNNLDSTHKCNFSGGSHGVNFFKERAICPSLEWMNVLNYEKDNYLLLSSD
jgi:hypothetical protein